MGHGNSMLKPAPVNISWNSTICSKNKFLRFVLQNFIYFSLDFIQRPVVPQSRGPGLVPRHRRSTPGRLCAVRNRTSHAPAADPNVPNQALFRAELAHLPTPADTVVGPVPGTEAAAGLRAS